MTNLLHLVVALVDDADARARFRDDPEAAVDGIDDLTVEDVAAVADLARTQVDPARTDVLLAPMDVRTDDGSPHEAAIRSLTSICDAAEAASG
ncbi:MAG: hypothetical protein OSA99_01965 [Acidimicrobiales bacterium]|nr:hypothetical protein [Acidimicrobiales bacterium]